MIHRSLTEWDRAQSAEREACARALVSRLPDCLAYAGLERFDLGGQAREIAIYRSDAPDRRFALVPGGTVRLGFPGDAGWQPTPATAAAWERCAADWDLPPLAEHLTQVLTPPREVLLPALVVETTAWEVGWTPVDRDDPEVRAIVASRRDEGTIEVGFGPGTLRVRFEPDGTMRAERAEDLDQDDLLNELGRDGWRLPTPDEWEYLCAGGTGTLFRWGDEAPGDAYPIGPLPDFDAHRRPNAFGLRIAENPYLQEITAAPNLVRGGDGGAAMCGGAGIFLAGCRWHRPIAIRTPASGRRTRSSWQASPSHGGSRYSTDGRSVLDELAKPTGEAIGPFPGEAAQDHPRVAVEREGAVRVGLDPDALVHDRAPPLSWRHPSGARRETRGAAEGYGAGSEFLNHRPTEK